MEGFREFFPAAKLMWKFEREVEGRRQQANAQRPPGSWGMREGSAEEE